MANEKDIRKEKTMEKVKAKLQMDLQVRRQILDLIQQIELGEKSIELQVEHISDMQVQLESGKVRQQDKFGKTLDIKDFPRTITIFEMDLKKMKQQLDYFKEDLFHAVTVKDSVLHGRSYEEIKNYINNHYEMIRMESKKIVEILGG